MDKDHLLSHLDINGVKIKIIGFRKEGYWIDELETLLVFCIVIYMAYELRKIYFNFDDDDDVDVA